MIRQLHCAAIICLCALLFSAGSSRAGNTFIESFASTTYKDSVNTTADWNTGAGELRLFPFSPALMATFDTPGQAQGVAVEGDLAFVADYGSGLQIIDISNPASPALVGNYDTPGQAQGVAVAGDLAFVADHVYGLQIIDISNPASPVLIDTYNVSGTAYSVAVAGDLAFVASYGNGLQIVDISNPASPTYAGSYNTPGYAYDVAVAGDLAFVADGLSGGLQIIDISNPASTTLAGTYNTPGLAYGVAVAGDLAFVTDYSAGLQIVDISNPASPALVGTYGTLGGSRGVAVEGDLAFVADGESGFLMIDISNPASPTLVGTYDTPGNAWGVAVDGNLAFVADEGSGLQIIIIASPMSPALTGNYDTSGNAWGVAVTGDLAFMADGQYGLQLIDISDPASPTLAGAYNTSGTAYGVAVAGDLAFVADYGSGLQIIDIINPASPALVGTCDTPGNAWGVAVMGDLAFIADEDSGLQVIDISDPANPALVGTYDTPGYAYDVAVAGDLAFIADYGSGLQVIDISNPASPVFVGAYDTPGLAQSVDVAGDLAFVADDYSGLQIIDISNPASPALVGTYDTPGNAWGVAVAGDRAFIADDVAGLQVIGIYYPSYPTFFGTFDTPGVAIGVAAAGDLVFVGDYAAGLQVVQVYQYEIDVSGNIGRSLAVDGSSNIIRRARLSTTETAGVSWELSADNGVNWQGIIPDNAWNTFVVSGSDLQWRSTHTWSVSDPNPAVSELILEWLYEQAVIHTITDVPNDQGGRVYVELTRSAYDFTDEFINPVTQYGVHRRVDNTALLAEIKSLSNASIESKKDITMISGVAPLPGVETIWIEGTRYVLNASGASAAFPPGTWALVATVPATQNESDTYLVEVTTETDSSSAGSNYSHYVVTTHTTVPSTWFISQLDSGYSVDNIAPGVPQGFAVEYSTGSGNQLSWDPAPEEDFQYYRIYRSTDSSFEPSPGTLVQAIETSNWMDPDYDSGGVYYKVTATDFSGNESGAASAGTVSSAGELALLATFALHANVPNPFNPTTLIHYEVPENGGRITLRIYDVGGRLVRRLLEGTPDAGVKSVTWDGRDDAGRPVASGVYFCRLQAEDFVQTRKMALLK